MEVKKTKRAEIESHRGTWLLMGFIAVLTLMFMVFEWSQYDKHIDTRMVVKDMGFIEMVPITVQEKPLPPPPPPMPVATEEFVVVTNNSPEQEGTVAGTEMASEGVTPIFRPVVEEIAPEEDIIVVFAETMPSFPGGQKELNGFLSKNLKYPPSLQEIGVYGKVIIQFVVDKDGSITNAEVVRGVHPLIDKEALRVINMMPKWNPGKQNHKPVRVKYTIPVAFVLQ